MPTQKLYGPFLRSLANKEIDLDSDSLKVMLCTSAYTPDQDTHRYKTDVTGEVSAAPYVAGGVALANVVVAYNASTNTLSLDADDSSFPASAGEQIAARYAVVYDDTPSSASAKPLICYLDMDQTITSTGAPFKVQWNAAGLVTIAAA